MIYTSYTFRRIASGPRHFIGTFGQEVVVAQEILCFSEHPGLFLWYRNFYSRLSRLELLQNYIFVTTNNGKTIS